MFEIGPVFRADPSFTSRHMTEFTGIDMEMSWVDRHEDVMAFMERWLQYTLQKVKEQHGEEIKERLGFDLVVPEVPFPRITMKDAVEILKERGYKLPPEKKGDIDPAGERELGNYVKEKYNHDFVFLIDWPITVRPFYHMRHPDAPTLTRSFDLIGSGLEITTGAQREHRYDVLAAQALEKGLTLEPIQFYLDFFNYGCPPHGGFGLGLSRLLMIMLGLNNIREAVYHLPRTDPAEPVEEKCPRVTIRMTSETSQVRLRPLEREDLHWFVEWFTDPEVLEFLGLHNPLSQAREEKWYEKILEGPEDEHPFAIEVNEGWRLAGDRQHRLLWDAHHLPQRRDRHRAGR